MISNMALNPVRFALWTLRDKAAQRRLALRWATWEYLAQPSTCLLTQSVWATVRIFGVKNDDKRYPRAGLESPKETA